MRLPISLDRSSLAQTASVSLVTLAALALLALVLAYWTWVWMAPRPAPRAAAFDRQPLHLEPAFRLFGGAPRTAGNAAPTGLAVDLLGVAASSGGKPGYAVLRLDAKRVVAVREGDQVEPGVKLAEVYPDRAVLERAGVRETVALPEKAKRK
jgi:general secretion pathway protein C